LGTRLKGGGGVKEERGTDSSRKLLFRRIEEQAVFAEFDFGLQRIRRPNARRFGREERFVV
jgi:hypothetical protein